MFDSLWMRPPEELVLDIDEIHVWLVSLNSSGVSSLEHIISNDERARAAQFHLPQHRIEYVASRINLRTILSKYIAVSPELLDFGYTEHGKPFIANETNSKFKFNFSHSNGFALYAVTLYHEIGVDLELVQPLLINKEVALKVFTDDEFAHFNTLAASDQIEFFYKCWTRKEAYSKALGKGLSINPNKIETVCPSTKSICKIKTDKVFQKMNNWSFFDLPIITGFASGAVIEGINKTKLKCWRIPNRRLCNDSQKIHSD